MILEVLGTGCARCKRLHEAVLEAVATTGLETEVRKVEDIAQILQAGVLSTPALVKDGKVLFAGKLPSSKEIAALISA